MSAAIARMRAKSVLQARKAARGFSAPSQNLVVADKHSISLQTIGKMPRRGPHHTSRGRIPSQGWLAQNRWNGYFNFEANPYVRNPASGIVANTNNKLTDAPFPSHVSHTDPELVLRRVECTLLLDPLADVGRELRQIEVLEDRELGRVRLIQAWLEQATPTADKTTRFGADAVQLALSASKVSVTGPRMPPASAPVVTPPTRAALPSLSFSEIA